MDSHREVLLEMASANETWEKKLQDPSATPVALPLEFLKAITCDFSAEQELGSGGYGVVYKGVLSSGKLIAVKNLVDLHNMGHEKFEKEVSSLMGIKHQNVVQFLDESSGLEWNMRYEIIRGICGGLHYLHKECIVHLDLKPENILMDATMVPKIADFGLSRIFGNKQSRIITQSCLGTRGYMAPEYIIQGIVSIKADIYSFGVIIIEILTGCRYYPLNEDNSPESTDTSFQHFKERILKLWRNRLQKSQGDTLLEQVRLCIELGIQCVASNPGKRPVTKHIIDKLDEVTTMDESIKAGVSTASTVAQAGEVSHTLQQGNTKSDISRGQERGRGGHHANLTDVYEKVRAGKTKSGVKVSFHSIPDKGEPSTTRFASSADEANKHHALERILCDKSVEPTFLELSLLGDITNNFSDDREIARSRLGVLYKGKLSNGSNVAVKRLAISIAIGDKLFLHAVNSLMSVKHSNIVRFLGYCANAQGKVAREEDKCVIVIVRERLLCFEYLCKGNLQMHLNDESREYDWHARYKTIKGICEGLHYLHDNCISHLDLKPDNVLFDEKMVPKILDYGFSRVFSEDIRRSILKNIDGSLAYMATPEYLTGGEITLKSDIYSLGIIIMQIVTGENKTNYSNISGIVESWRNRFKLDASKGGHTFDTCYHQVKVCIELGICCMGHDPGKRPITRYIINRLDETERSVISDISALSKMMARMQINFPSKATLLPSGEELTAAPVPSAPPTLKLLHLEVIYQFPRSNNRSNLLPTTPFIP